MDIDQDLEYLSYVDRSEDARYNSKAVFSDVGLGLEVKEYDDFVLYEWEDEVDFDELLETVEPFFPLCEDPALEMVKEKGRVRDSRDDHDSLTNELVYDPVADLKGKDRWGEYSLIQINLNGAKVVWDEKEGSPRVRVYEIGDVDVFRKVFPELSDFGSEDFF